MRTELVVQPWFDIEADLLIYPVFEQENNGETPVPGDLDEKLGGLPRELMEGKEWTGAANSFFSLHRPQGIAADRLLLAGAGKADEFDSLKVRSLAIRAVRQIRSQKIRKVVFFCPQAFRPAEMGQAVTEGIVLGTLDIDQYKTKDRKEFQIDSVALGVSQAEDSESFNESLQRGLVLAEATNFARRLINEPGNRVGPRQMAERAREVAEDTGLEIDVFDESKMEELGMNAVLAVARGSEAPPRLIILRHRGREAKNPDLALVGKGVTFDSGGLSLKPAASMEEMKSDKAGACAVMGAMYGIARLQIPLDIVALLPCVENLPGGRAQRPGDVVQSFSGKTIEVLNTDAEGRLILADALSYAVRILKAQKLVDIATLTGSCLVALGNVRAGLFANDEKLAAALTAASQRAGEPVWKMPMDSEYRKQLDSDIADIKNVGGRWGGAITAAKFLEEFVDDSPWCHLDIAGVDLFKEKQEVTGPTGFGVRTLAELALYLSKS